MLLFRSGRLWCVGGCRKRPIPRRSHRSEHVALTRTHRQVAYRLLPQTRAKTGSGWRPRSKPGVSSATRHLRNGSTSTARRGSHGPASTSARRSPRAGRSCLKWPNAGSPSSAGRSSGSMNRSRASSTACGRGRRRASRRDAAKGGKFSNQGHRVWNLLGSTEALARLAAELTGSGMESSARRAIVNLPHGHWPLR